MLHVYRAGLLVWGFYLMGLGCKKKGGGRMLDWGIANGNDYNLNCVNQTRLERAMKVNAYPSIQTQIQTQSPLSNEDRNAHCVESEVCVLYITQPGDF